MHALLSRRSLLRAIPEAALGTAAFTVAGGAHSGHQAPELRRIPLAYPNLPRPLEGVRILQLSDLHLGYGLSITDLRKSLENALKAATRWGKSADSGGPPIDLVAITGDLAEKPELFEPALATLRAVFPETPAFACLGNHEFYRDVGLEARDWAPFGVTLLRDTATTISLRGESVHLAAVDDPLAHETAEIDALLGPKIAVLGEAVAAAAHFRILLSHRPDAHALPGGSSFDLVLSGHTHGGQFAFLGTSLLDWITGRKMHWGTYETRLGSRTSRLYTTSGFGDWFPFRIGCPRELPILELRAGT